MHPVASERQGRSLTAAALVGVVPTVVVAVTAPPQRDAAVVVTAEVSIWIAGLFICKHQQAHKASQECDEQQMTNKNK